ncbi:MAG: rRNA pseudouridine synthase [Clostridia bacterium]|nr:rRNA pseudouridine synthase [Clostridia bacterium]
MRLDKFLSDSTDMSRKDIKQLIRKKAVTVNGDIAIKPETQVSENDAVTVNGQAVLYKRFVYLILNKPAGYVSATEDKKYPIVTELVPEEYRHFDVFPAGRLDIDTEGLLILTNDGEFVHDITSPKKNVYKRYFARLDKPAEEADKAVFGGGMEFKDFTAKPARLEICDDAHEAFVEIAEGKFHQVKRMFERVGKTVVYLKRVSIGGLGLPDSLKLGEVKEIEYDELLNKIYG